MPSFPSPPRVGVECPRTRADTAAFEFGDADQLPDVDIPDGPVDLRDAFTYAFKCIAQKRCFLFKQYELVASGRDGETVLNAEQFAKCTAVMFGVSQRVLKRAVQRGIDVSRQVHKEVRRGKHGGMDAHFPLFAHCDGQRMLAVDTAWPTRGYLSEHGVTHIVDVATGIVVSVCQLTKNAKPGTFALIDLDPPVLFSYLRNSGDMDADGMEACVGALSTHLEGLEACGLCKDGDAKGKAAAEMSDLWWDARCKCHVVKNVVKLLRKMGSTKCPGGCGGAGGSCNYKKGWRFNTGQVGSVAGRLFTILRQAERMYLPELEDPMLLRTCVDGPGSTKREVNRAVAIRSAHAQIHALYLHVTGDHGRCDHRDLDEDPTSPHPRLRCEAQKRRLATVLCSVQDVLDQLLTPFGLVDVNFVESDHADIARFRPKEFSWGALTCFLATNMAFLNIQQVKVGYWGVATFPIVELAQELMDEYGIDIGITEEDIELMETRLAGRVQQKARRSTDEWRAKRKVRASRKFARSKTAKRSSYQSGGTEASLERGGGGGGGGAVEEKIDPLVSWHGSSVVLDDSELDVVDGALESDDE